MEKTVYKALAKDGTSVAQASTQKAVREMAEAGGLVWDDLRLENCGKTAEPFEHLVQNYRVFMNALLRDTGAHTHQLYLTGKNNFRDKLWDGYKAHRDRSARPIHFYKFREFLVSKEKAKIVDGMEADDALGIMQCKALKQGKPRTMIASLDKDLDQIPGSHYNWKKKELYTITPDQGMRFFWYQMLVGDASENIRKEQKIARMGPVSALKLMEGIPTQNLKDVVWWAYRDHFGEVRGRELFDLNAKLLWIKRKV